jgi:hypothetical protein
MITILRHSTTALVVTGLLASVSSAAAAVLYDNGALNGSISGFTIGGDGGTDGVVDSFTLQANSAITGIDFGVWTMPGDTVSTVDWGITTVFGSESFDPSNFIAGGTAAVFNGPTHLNSLGWPIGVNSFSTGAVNLAAGTYYLVLQNAVAVNAGTPDGNPVYWDETDGLSSAYSSVLTSLYNAATGASGSESFQIFGTSSVEVPEPASWVLMLIGFAGLGATLRGARILRRAESPSAPAPHPPSAILSR